MNWNLVESQNYIKTMETYKINSLLAKYLDAKLVDFSLYSMDDSSLHDYKLLNDSKKVIDRIEKAICHNEKIVIYGDYDCDGIMATSILVAAFEKRGIQVGYHIPNRFIDGYGLNEQRVKQMHERGYTLIITVDNGVKAFSAVELANQLGIDVIISDHHDIGKEQPKAYALLHTMLSPNYPFKEISGGYLAYKLATQIIGKEDLYLMCLAGISTISDMMPVWNENRTLIKKTIELLNKYKFESISLLLQESKTFNVQAIGFQIAPKINSIGRMVDGLNPNQCVKYFKTAFSKNQIEREFKIRFATLAEEINIKRKDLTNSQLQLAIKKMQVDKKTIFIYDDSFHEGIIGLIASRLTKDYEKPSFVLSYDKDKETYKGSARSINGFDLNTLFEHLKSQVIAYGGHELAGGFSLQKENIITFSSLIEEEYRQINGEELSNAKETVVIQPEDLTIKNIKELALLEPFGTNNEEPIFCILDVTPLKVETLSNGAHLKLHFETKDCQYKALFFNQGKRRKEILEKDKLTMIGTLSINKFRNFETIQFILLDIT